MSNQEPEKQPETVVLPKGQLAEMERFRKGETTGDVILLPDPLEPVDSDE